MCEPFFGGKKNDDKKTEASLEVEGISKKKRVKNSRNVSDNQSI
jgi:hypothetical protein